jgi:hypothetical protein
VTGQSEAANRANIVDPAKLVEIIQRWCPSAPVEVPVTLAKALIEAAATGGSGELRLSLLDEFVVGLAGQLCTNGHKIVKLKRETARMAGDPLHRPQLRPGHPAELARVALIAVKRADGQVLGVEKIRIALRRVKPKIRRTSTYALVKRMTDGGWFERVDAGVYGLPGRSRKPYEPRTLQLLRLVYQAPDHAVSTREACTELDWSPKLLSATASELSSRKLLKSRKSVHIVPQEIVDKLARGEGVRIAPGKVFYARAGAPTVDHSSFATLRAERPRIDRGAQAKKIASLNALKGEQLRIAVAAAAKEWASDPEDLAERLSKSAQRNLRRESAREKWREKATRLMEQYPERSPKPLRGLFKDLGIEGLTLRTFLDVVREVAAALLEQKGLRLRGMRPVHPHVGYSRKTQQVVRINPLKTLRRPLVFIPEFLDFIGPT